MGTERTRASRGLAAPPAPSLVAPANQAQLSDTTPDLEWSAVVDPAGEPVTYELQVDDSGSGFPSPEIDQTGLAVTSLTVPSALAGGTLLGLLGALVAIPVAASILIIVKQVIIPRQNEL